jgi:hypothetical protein
MNPPGRVQGGTFIVLAAVTFAVCLSKDALNALAPPAADAKKKWEDLSESLRTLTDEELRAAAVRKHGETKHRNDCIRELERRRKLGSLEVILFVLYSEPGYPGRLSLVEMLSRNAHPASEAALEQVALKDRDPVVRYVATTGLQGTQIDTLAQILQRDASPLVRRAAIRAVSKVKDGRALDILKSTSLKDDDLANRKLAEKCLTGEK